MKEFNNKRDILRILIFCQCRQQIGIAFAQPVQMVQPASKQNSTIKMQSLSLCKKQRIFLGGL